VSAYAERQIAYDEHERCGMLVFVEQLVKQGYSEREITREVERRWIEGPDDRKEHSSRVDRLRAARGLLLF
jgi:hypothetical protein